MAQTIAAAAPEQPAAAAGKSKTKLLIIVLSAVAVLAIGGGIGAVVFLKGGGEKAVVSDDEQATADTGEEKGAKSAKAKKDGAGKDAKDKKKKHVEREYLTLAPSFVVNFQAAQARVRFLKVDLDTVASDATALEAVKKHMPAVRNAIVLLLSKQQYEDLVTPEGKERLRGEVLAAMQKVLEEQTGKKTVDDVYFSSFVMQ